MRDLFGDKIERAIELLRDAREFALHMVKTGYCPSAKPCGDCPYCRAEAWLAKVGE